MINDTTLQKLFRNAEPFIKKFWKDENLITDFNQIYRGTPTFIIDGSSDCRKATLIFNEYNIIPKECFDCFKIIVSIGTVVDLFKLLILFERLDKPLPEDTRKKVLNLPENTLRKCIIELRRNISGPYKGLIYFKGLEKAKKAFDHVKDVVNEEISPHASVALKRGCTHFAVKFPEYEKLDEAHNPIMEYKEEWQSQEQVAEQKNIGADLLPLEDSFTYNKPSFDLFDAKVMLVWLKYAATIGDMSYMRITSEEVPKFESLKNPPWKPNTY